MKNWYPVSHFGLKVFASFLLSFVVMVAGTILIVFHLNLTGEASNNAIMVMFAAVLLALSHWWLHLPLFKRPQHIGIASGFVLVMIATNLLDTKLHWSLFPTALLNGICIGFAEEVLCRGPLLFWLWTKTPRRLSPDWWTAITSAIIFGALHLSNYSANPDWTQILIQVGYATAMGFAAAGILLYTHNLGLTIIMHAGFDTIAGMDGGNMNSYVALNWCGIATTAIIVVVNLVIGTWLMRQLSRENHELRF